MLNIKNNKEGFVMHEYTITNQSRHKILFWMTIIASTISVPITVLLNRLMSFFQLGAIISFSISSLTVFTILYWLFNNYIWKFKKISKLMGLPDISGKWINEGKSHNIVTNKKYNWKSEIIITQKWDKILIVSKNENSSDSKSIVGGMHFVEGKGFDFSYHYLNTPVIGQKNLNRHEGFCVLCFSEDLSCAEGYYFNNVKDRSSYGEMKLKRG